MESSSVKNWSAGKAGDVEEEEEENDAFDCIKAWQNAEGKEESSGYSKLQIEAQ